MEQVSVFDINKICRVCLEEGILVSIYSHEYAISPLDMIISCTNVKITDNDELPSSICSNCIYRLGVAYQFKQQCENSDMRLRECLGLELGMIDVEANDKDVVKQEKQVISNIEPDVVQQLVSNNDSATQVKDEEIYAAMNAVCEIFGDAENPDVSLLHHHDNTNSPNDLIQAIPIANDNQMIQSDYLDPDVLNENNMVNLRHSILVEEHNILEQGRKLLQQENDLLEQSNQILVHEHNNQILVQKQLASNKILITDNDTETMKDKNSEISDDFQYAKTLKKPKRKKVNKTLKTRDDLDKFLEQRKTKKKSQKRPGKMEKKNKELLKMPEQCFDCGKTFAYSGYLDAHIRTHTGERPYHCHLCKLKFAQAGNLALHMRVHTGERPYQCEICSKLFTTSSNLKAHQRIHSETRDYKCNQCERAFKSPSELVSHAGTHTGVKNHICKLCGKAFYKTSYLNVHFRTVHVGEKRHRCSECGKEFSNSSNLTCHFRIHTGEKPFSCKHCNAKFNQSSALIRHSKQHTNCYRPLKSKSCLLGSSTNTERRTGPQPLPTIITIPSSIIPDYKSTISDLTINSFSNYMKLPEQSTLLDFTKTTMLDYSKNQNSYSFNQ